MAPYDRNSGSYKTGQAALPHKNIHKKPMILVLAGPNGSGKSTITTFFDKVGKYTNADDIVAATGMAT